MVESGQTEASAPRAEASLEPMASLPEDVACPPAPPSPGPPAFVPAPASAPASAASGLSAAAPPPRPALAPSAPFAELKLISEIGIGGYSTVLLADLHGTRFAVKVFNRHAYKDAKEV